MLVICGAIYFSQDVLQSQLNTLQAELRQVKIFIQNPPNAEEVVDQLRSDGLIRPGAQTSTDDIAEMLE